MNNKTKIESTGVEVLIRPFVDPHIIVSFNEVSPRLQYAALAQPNQTGQSLECPFLFLALPTVPGLSSWQTGVLRTSPSRLIVVNFVSCLTGPLLFSFGRVSVRSTCPVFATAGRGQVRASMQVRVSVLRTCNIL
jgi:hypothetical protein